MVINSTISGNFASTYGGGVTIEGNSVAHFINSTITGNRADFDNNGTESGGGINLFGLGSKATLENTIVAGNFVDAGSTPSDINIQSGTVTGSHNLIGDAGTAGGLVNGKNGNIVGVNGAGTRNIATILNTTLQNNGGPTPTHALVAGSIAIDRGKNLRAVDENNAPLTIEQRGTRRIFDGDGDGQATVDIGAVERGPVAVNGALIFDTSNGSFRLAVHKGDALTWFQTGAFGKNQLGFVADFDGDGLLDGMLYNTTTNRFNFLRNKGDGTLAAPVSAGSLNGAYTWGNFMVGDYDGDGRAEVMAQILAGPIGVGSMRSQDSSGVNRFYITMNTGFQAMLTGDFNGDGIDDIVGLFDNVQQTRTNIIPAYSISTPVGRRMTAVLASGQIGQSVATGGLHNFLVRDFNGDGRADLALRNANGQMFTATTVGDARNNAPDVRNFVASAASPNFNPAQYGNPILAGLFDNNVRADLFTIRNNDQLIVALTTLSVNNTPVQTTSAAGTSAVGEQALIGDFNGDGLEDVIVLGVNAARYLSQGTVFGPATMLGGVINGPIGSMGMSRVGRVF